MHLSTFPDVQARQVVEVGLHREQLALGISGAAQAKAHPASAFAA
jgi:hypothetical protein